MKVIDLLNKIANEEEVPKHIHIRDLDTYTWQEDIKEYWSDKDENNLLFDLDLSTTKLKEDIDIIEEDKKIEKFKVIKDNSGDSVQLVYYGKKLELTFLQAIILDKINEIIDYLEMDNE